MDLAATILLFTLPVYAKDLGLLMAIHSSFFCLKLKWPGILIENNYPFLVVTTSKVGEEHDKISGHS